MRGSRFSSGRPCSARRSSACRGSRRMFPLPPAVGPAGSTPPETSAAITGAMPGAAGRRVSAGVSEAGLWASDDGGATWRPLNQKGATRITHRTYNILFDPKDPQVFWVSGSYGPGIFKTIDGGESFERLGTLEHVDGIAVDFADPKRT